MSLVSFLLTFPFLPLFEKFLKGKLDICIKNMRLLYIYVCLFELLSSSMIEIEVNDKDDPIKN